MPKENYNSADNPARADRSNKKQPTTLTVERVKALRSGSIADTAPHSGLRLIARATGTKTWIYRYRPTGGKLKQIKLGNYPAMGLAAAREAFRAQKAIRDDATQGDPLAARDRQRIEAARQVQVDKMRAYTVTDLVEQYRVEHIEHARVEKGRVEYARLMKKDVLPFIGDIPAADIQRQDVHEIIQRIAKRIGHPCRHQAVVKNELSGAFEWGIDAGKFPDSFSNPCPGIKVPKQNKRKRAFSDPELATFLKWLPNVNMSERMRVILEVMLLTGVRGGEAVSASWDDIDLSIGQWHMEQTKNGEPHTIYLSTQAVALLSAWKDAQASDKAAQGNNWVFPSPYVKGSHVDQKTIVLSVRKHRPESGLKHWTGHDLRRSCATGLARLKYSREVQNRVLNHVDTSVGGIYDRHNYDAESKEAWQHWGDHLDGLQASNVVPLSAAS